MKTQEVGISVTELLAKYPTGVERLAKVARFPLQEPLEFAFSDSPWHPMPPRQPEGEGAAAFVLSGCCS